MARKHFAFQFTICGLFLLCKFSEAARAYYGARIGALSQLHHGVSGEVYAVDSRTLFVKNLNYDGEGPAAYFYVGNSKRPSNNGASRLRDERGSTGVIKRYRNKDITLSLPEGKTLRDIKWFSIWCDEFAVNFGDVTIPRNFEYPRPYKIGSLKGVHAVSSDNIVIVDAQTILIPNFTYDGEAPDAKFWVGRGQRPTPNGIRIPDENGRETPLARYDRKTVVLTLPGDLTVFDIGHFGVWCEAFTVDFGHVVIPENINVPPSLKMLGISPQSKLNCEVLYDDLAYEVRWAVAGESIVIQLVAKLDEGEYMSFGLSPDPQRTMMIGADVAVSWIDKNTGKGYAEDYYLDAKSQCSGNRGSCPDTRLADKSNSIRVLNAAMVNGYSIVTFQRPLKATDRYDLQITPNISQAIVWAIGPLNQRLEVSYHSLYTKGDRFIQFGREPQWNCPLSEAEMKMSIEEEEELYEQIKKSITPPPPQNQQFSRPEPAEANRRGAQSVPARVSTQNRNKYWEIPPIQCHEPEDGVFYAQMGPTGGKQGYPAITGHVGWGISWYINGLLIPEINVVRGKTYTFVVEGGNDPDTPARYHPFYITDDPVGGYEYKSDEEKAKVRIYAGVKRSRYGDAIPIGIGRLCNWTPDIDGPPADEYSSFGAYQRSLTLKCEEGEPGIITWRPDHDTPDTVYYQCFTHRYLGWKINVLDNCDHRQAQSSELTEVFANPDRSDGFETQASIRHETKIKPDDIFLLQNEEKIQNPNILPHKTYSDVNKNTEISKIIADGIRAAEALEESIKNKTQPEEEESTTPTIGNITEPIVKEHTIEPLPMFLTPPRNTIIRPFRLDGRIPIRNKNPPVKLPVPSTLVNHYKNQNPQVIRIVYKEDKPVKPLVSLFLLEQPEKLKGPMDHRKHVKIPLPQTSLRRDFAKIPARQAHLNIPPYLNKQRPIRRPINHGQKNKFSGPYNIKREEFSSDIKAPNPGFKPDSVIIESGFRPIVKRRNDKGEVVEIEEDEEEVEEKQFDEVDEHDEEEYEDGQYQKNRRNDHGDETEFNTDALFNSKSAEVPLKTFEPMFIPSPPDSTKMSESKYQGNFTDDLQDMEMEDGEDKMAMAGERHSYYLPPDNKQKVTKLYPEGTVVTFDGKAVMDMSLARMVPSTQMLSFRGANNRPKISSTEQLVHTPQFGPFRGEIPPLAPKPKSSEDTRPETSTKSTKT